jgi:hypothetical protein
MTVGVVLVLLVVSALLIVLQPDLANHFGYALPGKDGLPYRIHFAGRDYATYQVCADADWCVQDRERLHLPRCYDQGWLQSHIPGQLIQVATIWTLLGASYAVLSPRSRGVTAPLIVADGTSCFVIYTLEGGP